MGSALSFYAAAMSDSPALWARVARAPAIQAEHIRALLAQDGSLQALERLRRSALSAAGWPPAVIASLAAVDTDTIAADVRWIERYNCTLLACSSPDYPPQLAELRGAPAVLFVRGDASILRHPQLAMVGSRNPTAGGRSTARDFAQYFARAGLAITSGLALGIDGACHEGALAADGLTLAVCGHGLDQIYPPQHAALAAQILAHGALVSEFAPGVPPLKAHFPQRNRIIAGLALGTLVVEAARESGSLITARHAGEAGRDVFAIPGSIHNPLARGCHQLIRQGAKLVESAADVLSELPFQLEKQRLSAVQQPSVAPSAGAPTLDNDYKILLDALAFEPVTVDTLVERTEFPSESVASMLLILELEGLVQPQPGGRYSLSQPRT
ncbi:MAG: DNA-processing protein DprA [Steroidobacteraceae bacterium]